MFFEFLPGLSRSANLGNILLEKLDETLFNVSRYIIVPLASCQKPTLYVMQKSTQESCKRNLLFDLGFAERTNLGLGKYLLGTHWAGYAVLAVSCHSYAARHLLWASPGNRVELVPVSKDEKGAFCRTAGQPQDAGLPTHR